eukprot:TRINITY_DN6970_c0_g1_i1.p1 TRINITY_DN6970_c0_g1~~TRINITY_DN6970_c0_g1_i1.p1  ORF type:complete len:721 (+),score=283.95 TRINITY_DN6970_c0_g1_i1:84-2246(+)
MSVPMVTSHCGSAPLPPAGGVVAEEGGLPEEARLAVLEANAGRAAAERHLAELRREALRWEVEAVEGRAAAEDREEALRGAAAAEAAAARWQRQCQEAVDGAAALQEAVAELEETVRCGGAREAALEADLAEARAAHDELRGRAEEHRLRCARAERDLQTHLQTHKSAEAASERTLRNLRARLTDAEHAASDYEERCLAAQRDAKALKLHGDAAARERDEMRAALDAAAIEQRRAANHAQALYDEIDALTREVREARRGAADAADDLARQRAQAAAAQAALEERLAQEACAARRLREAARQPPPQNAPAPQQPPDVLAVVAQDVAQVLGCYDIAPGGALWGGRAIWQKGSYRLYSHHGRWMLCSAPEHMGTGRGYLRAAAAAAHPAEVQQWERCVGAGGWVASKTSVRRMACADDEGTVRFMMAMLTASVDALRGTRKELKAAKAAPGAATVRDLEGTVVAPPPPPPPPAETPPQRRPPRAESLCLSLSPAPSDGSPILDQFVDAVLAREREAAAAAAAPPSLPAAAAAPPPQPPAGVECSAGARPGRRFPRPGEATPVAGGGRGRRAERFKPVAVAREPPPPPPPPSLAEAEADADASPPGMRETETAVAVDTPPGAPHAATSPEVAVAAFTSHYDSPAAPPPRQAARQGAAAVEESEDGEGGPHQWRGSPPAAPPIRSPSPTKSLHPVYAPPPPPPHHTRPAIPTDDALDLGFDTSIL